MAFEVDLLVIVSQATILISGISTASEIVTVTYSIGMALKAALGHGMRMASEVDLLTSCMVMVSEVATLASDMGMASGMTTLNKSIGMESEVAL